MNIVSDTAMQNLGESIARRLRGNETIELIGDVGAGKTTFVRGLARGLGVKDQIQSPTFTISREYMAKDNIILKHYDFYRLDEPGIMADEIREATYDPFAVVVVEWASSISQVLPENRIVIRIQSDENDADIRNVEIKGLKYEINA